MLQTRWIDFADLLNSTKMEPSGIMDQSDLVKPKATANYSYIYRNPDLFLQLMAYIVEGRNTSRGRRQRATAGSEYKPLKNADETPGGRPEEA